MARPTNPKAATEPEIVALLKEALSERLGRPASVRASRGDKERWVISDPTMFYLQRGKTANPTGYRCGLLYADEEIRFYHEHARATADLLKKNLITAPHILYEAAAASAQWRTVHFIGFSSREQTRKSKRLSFSETTEQFLCDDWKEFAEYLENQSSRIPADLFPELPSVGNDGSPAPHRGTFFQMLIAQDKLLGLGGSLASRYKVATEVISAAWPLFSCLYPWEPLVSRTADLARFMRAAGIEKKCEYTKISTAPISMCSGDALEAAHIVPDRRGGSDRAWNGLWLCKGHHKITEGLLEGCRDHNDLDKLHVKFKGSNARLK